MYKTKNVQTYKIMKNTLKETKNLFITYLKYLN